MDVESPNVFMEFSMQGTILCRMLDDVIDSKSSMV